MNYKNIFSEEKTVIFLHLPKTGGLSLVYIASTNYDSSSVYIIDERPLYSIDGQVSQSIKDLKGLPLQEKRKIKFLAGHTSFGIHEYIPNESTYITLLREPVDRVISCYYYLLANPDHLYHKDLTQNNMSFEEFLYSQDSKQFTIYDNFQVRLLSGITGVKYGKCYQEMLEAAKLNLNNFFSMVGLTEKFDDFLILCEKNLGWKFVSPQRRNVNSNRPSKNEISEKALRKIEADNALDIELYNYVKKQVEKS
ncbi:sulfotransferase family 2 domain-containing protein [uncultured Nostoc sp.]|uniref:sulfotransferase family 2 domain-containing protein n=1 Tax=uncultured Nostoc sp. TaxID=340711 RepID=UPI0035CC4D8C